MARFSALSVVSALGALVALGLPACSAEPSGDEDAEGALTDGTRPWDAAAERSFSDWVARIGTARAEGRCVKLNECINDARINTLRGPNDAPLDLFADCADVPMELRGYFAVKTGRPFRYVSAVEGVGADMRYGVGIHPAEFATAGGSSTMQRLMSRISAVVHSGFFRTAPEVEDTDTYPISPSRASLRPGTVFYDPNGHVLIVFKVDADGTIWTMDGHPDNSLTFGRFTEGTYAVGGRAQGGGFRNFRPQRAGFWGDLEAATNAELPDFGDDQYGHGADYFDWLTVKMGGTAKPPEKKLGERVEQLCIDLAARVRAVDAARAVATGPLAPQPPNIYAAEGDWEAFSTPSRDARLRASLRAMTKFVGDSLRPLSGAPRRALADKLAAAWRTKATSTTCQIAYANSAGTSVPLSLDAIVARIYDLSFDPYHCPEMRWGAHPSASAELSTCPNADADHLARFEAERRQRNVIDRTPATVTGPDYGPERPEDIDVVALLARESAAR